MYKNAELLGSDPIIEQAIRLFESEFFSETESLAPKKKLKVYEYPGLVIELKKHVFSDAFVARFLDEKLKLLRETSSDHLLNFAALHQERPLAREILKDIQAKSPEVIAEARRDNVSIRSTSTTNRKSRIINLFKSKQEQNFFEAVREAFPTYHPYPMCR
jgi:predicted proteasome-type protease